MYHLTKLLLLCVTLGWAVTATARGPEQEFSKTIQREFATTANGKTALYNKYGKVNVNTWNENKVKITITIVVNAGDQRIADNAFDRIKINFTNTSGYVKAETFIDSENASGWWKASNGYDDYKINYEVWMPVGNQLDLRNKYGNSYVANLNGFLKADIKYGDLRTENISNDADLNISYGKATLARVNNLKGLVSYGGITLGEARDVQLDSKYSEIKFEKSRSVRITSKYDDFSLGNLSELRLLTKYANVRVNSADMAMVTAQYTDLKVNSIVQSLDADLSYGSLKINSLSRNFTAVNVVAQYTDVQVLVENGASFRFEAEGTHSDVKYPNGASVSRRDESTYRTNVKGYVGDANAKGTIRTKLSYGGITMK